MIDTQAAHVRLETFRGAWRLNQASLSWDEADRRSQSAAEVFDRLIGVQPATVLASRVPTISLPCRSYARGEASGTDIEVSVEGAEHQVEVRLHRTRDTAVWAPFMQILSALEQRYGAGLALLRVDLHLDGTIESIPRSMRDHFGPLGPAMTSRWFGDSRQVEAVAIDRSFVLAGAAGRQLSARASASSVSDGAISWSHLVSQAIYALET